MIPITVVKTDEATEALVLEVLRSGELAQGRFVDAFERRFADLHEVAHAIAVNSGTTALVAALQALDLGPGDEVITTPFTFVATLNAILEAGASARFADIGDDFNLDPAAVKEEVSERTRVLMPVHLYGLMADLDPLGAIALEHDLALVEDAAQAVGATYHGVKAGGTGIGCFSLYATKNISTGEGGMITTSDDDLAHRLRLLRNQGMRRRYEYEIVGHNYRLTNLAAAVGLPQLDRVHEINAQRQRNAAVLTAGLRDLEGIVVPPPAPTGCSHVYHQYTVRIADDAVVSRDEFVDRLTRSGVGCGVYYPRLVFDYECYRDHPAVIPCDVPRATAAARQVVSLPVHPHLTESELDQIVASVREGLGQ